MTNPIDSLFVAPPLPSHYEGWEEEEKKAIRAYGLQCFRAAFDQKAAPVAARYKDIHDKWVVGNLDDKEAAIAYGCELLYLHPPLIVAQSARIAELEALLNNPALVDTVIIPGPQYDAMEAALAKAKEALEGYRLRTDARGFVSAFTLANIKGEETIAAIDAAQKGEG